MQTDHRATKRRLLVPMAILGLVVAACTAGESPSPSPVGTQPTDGDGNGNGAAGPITMLSSQLAPIEEAERFREVLADFDGEVDFIGEEAGPFIDRITAEAQTGEGSIHVLGGLHGDFASLDQEVFMDLSGLADELSALGLNENFLELGRLGSDKQIYIPWMQATYIMAARQEALDYLPEGADIENLTWEQLTEWGRNIQEETGDARLGFPAGEDGLLHRFFQGFGIPAYTGGVNTTFASDGAIAMWEWMQDTWQYVNPQSTTYGFMQDPLQSGEVWVAWDHVARLIDALRNDPEAYVTFPVPSGPEGRAFMPVVVGLAIPANSPDPEAGMDLIRFLVEPETQLKTLQAVAFFPVVETGEATDLDPGVQLEQEAVAAQIGASDALPSLLPVGLGDFGGAYNKVFQDSFRAIVLDGNDAAEVVAAEAQNLQQVLDDAEAECWPPDPPSDGVCQVQ